MKIIGITGKSGCGKSTFIDYSSFDFDYIFENDYNAQSMNEMIDKISDQYRGGDER